MCLHAIALERFIEYKAAVVHYALAAFEPPVHEQHAKDSQSGFD